MKKVLFTMMAAAMLSVGFTACGGGDSAEGSADSTATTQSEPEDTVATYKVNPETTTVGGEFAKNFAIVEKEYTIAPDADYPTRYHAVTIQLERLDDGGAIEATPVFTLQVLDADGNVIGSDDIYKYDLSTALASNKGEVNAVKFDRMTIKGTPASLKVVTRDQKSSASSSSDSEGDSEGDGEGDSDDDSSSSVSESSSSSSTSSSDIDDYLDSYESAVNNLKSLAKKAQAGDPSALLDYSSYLSDLQECAEKLDNIKGELTAAQLARLNKIARSAASLN